MKIRSARRMMGEQKAFAAWWKHKRLQAKKRKAANQVAKKTRQAQRRAS